MRITLKKAVYENFKALRDFTLELDGQNAVVYGDNATGKSSLMDGFLWVLTGKDSLGSASFDVKTLAPNGEAIHGLDHSVELTFDIGGRELVLRRTLREKWVKTRGSADKVFSGHEQLFWVDGVPCSKTEFDARVADILPEETLRLLTSPAYFLGQLHWQKRRQILLSCCGDMTDAEVITSSPELAELANILGNRKMEDHKKVIAARRSEINKALTLLPARIDEATRALPDVTGVNTKMLDAGKAARQKQLGELRQQIVRIESGGEVADKTKSLREIESKLLEIKNRYTTDNNAKTQAKNREIQAVNNEIEGLASSITTLTNTIAANTASIEQKLKKMDELRHQWGIRNNEAFVYDEADTCPTCHQSLPADEVQAARDKALADFNAAKAAKLAEISEKGKELKAEAERLTATNTEAGQKIEALQVKKADAEGTRTKLLAEVEQLKAAADAYTNDAEYQLQLDGKQILEESIAELNANGKPQIDALQAEIAAIDADVQAIDAKLADFTRHQDGQKRITELQAEEKKLAAEFEKLEHELYLTEQFTKVKVNALEEKINSRFRLAKWKLFDVQVNGGLSECCEAMHNGVCYNVSLNNAMRINLGLDAINVLSEHYGVSVPVFIDNAESVTDILPTVGQQIKLVVSKPDKTLRVVVCENNTAEPALAAAAGNGRLF